MKELQFFEEFLSSEKSIISTKQGLFKFVSNLGERFAYNTFNSKLKLTEKYLYYCSFDLCNPMYVLLAKEELNLEEEILYIHNLMYHYLISHHFVAFNPQDCTIDDYKTITFTWQIPYHFMPIFSAYLFAGTIKDPTLDSFFSTWDRILQKAILPTCFVYKNANLFETIYNEWDNHFLGKEYFLILQTVYRKFSTDSSQKRILRDSTRELTLLFIKNIKSDCSISSYIIKALNNYASTLASYRQEVLYDYNKTFTPTSEYSFIYSYYFLLHNFSSHLLYVIQSNIKEHLLPNSSYTFAINNFDSISTTYDSILSKISDISDCTEKDYEVFLSTTYEDHQIKDALKCGRLKINHAAVQTHSKQISKNVQKYYNNIIEEFKNFINVQKKCSSPNSKSSLTLALGDDYLKKLQQNILRTLSYFKDYVNDNNSQKLPGIFDMRIPGMISVLRFHSYDLEQTKNILSS